jgi:uncharacterized repeat protein (TIGR03803 family)
MIFFRSRFTICSAALLAACGGPQPPTGMPGTNAIGGVSAHQSAATVSYRIVHRFHGYNDLGRPEQGLLNVNGMLYGTTTGDEHKHQCGTVFSMSSAGLKKTLYRFQSRDGCQPSSALIDVNGTFFGTTNEGGQYGNGVIFKLTVSGAESVLYSFKGVPDGAHPYGSLIDLDGTIYGTTTDGSDRTSACPGPSGDNGCGTVYSVTTSGTESVLYTFKGPPDGFWPGSLIAVNRKLYGVTQNGGALYWGTVYSVTTTGVEKVVYNFSGTSAGIDGCSPWGPLIDMRGTLYGTTTACGSSDVGTVYSVTTSGSEKVLYSFAGGSDGDWPDGLTAVAGTFYGTTLWGGGVGPCSQNSGCGTAYSVTPTGSEAVLHRFQGGSDGALPNGGLTDIRGTLYGTTGGGGGKGCSSFGCGTVFALTP